MNKQLSQKETLFRLIRIFLVQYLANVHNIRSFQNQALNILTVYVISIVKKLAIQSKRIVHMQGRTQTNCLHLLASIQLENLFDLQNFLQYFHKARQQNNNFHHMFFQKMMQNIFQNDIQTVNKYQKETRFSNILYLRTPYTQEPLNNLLPFKSSIDQAFQFPLEFNYKQTKNQMKREKKNLENLRAYSIRELRKQKGIKLPEEEIKLQNNESETGQKIIKKIKSFSVIQSL